MSAIRFQVMPPLAPDEYQELRDDIADRGVIEPIHVDEHGVVIDGHHRKRIADDLGIECPAIVHDDLDDAGKRSLAFTLNLKRRHLNREQRRSLIAESLRADPGLSNREHARRTGADHKTVQAVREESESTGEIPQSETRVSGDGRVRPASQPPRPEPEPEPGPEPETDEPPSWEPAGHIHPADLAALNRPEPSDTPHAKQEPTGPRRKPLTDDVLNAVVDLQKALRKWEAIVNDDRFPANKKQAGDLHLSDLHRAETSLKTIIAKFH